MKRYYYWFLLLLVEPLHAQTKDSDYFAKAEVPYNDVIICVNQRVWVQMPNNLWQLRRSDDGRVIDTQQFKKVSKFDNVTAGRAMVQTAADDWCIVNDLGEIQRHLKSEVRIQETLAISEGMIGVKVKVSKKRNHAAIFWTFMDTTGNLWEKQYKEIRSFSGGIAAVRKGTSWEFVNKQQKRAIKRSFSDAEGFSEQKAAVRRNQTDTKWVFINTDGNTTSKFDYDYAEPYSNGRAAVMSKTETNDKTEKKWYLIDPNGKEITKPEYDKFGVLSDGLIAFKKGNDWGFMDSSGNIKYHTDWDKVTEFRHGRAWVHHNKNGKSYWGILKHKTYQPIQLRWVLPAYTRAHESDFKLQWCSEDSVAHPQFRISNNGVMLQQEWVPAVSVPWGQQCKCKYLYEQTVALKSATNRFQVRFRSAASTDSVISEPLLVELDPTVRAERRLALVIGNNQYHAFPKLTNAVNDARSMTEALQRMDFEVWKQEDIDKQKLSEVIEAFLDTLRLDEVGIGLVFYSGHGAELKGENYLIPVDVSSNQDTAIQQCIRVQQLQFQMNETGKFHKTFILILDACRDNPWLGKSLSQPVAPARYEGMITAFATQPGSTSSDNRDLGKNGLYTEFLLKYIERDSSIQMIFNQVRKDIQESKGGSQIPQEATDLRGDVYLRRKKSYPAFKK